MFTTSSTSVLATPVLLQSESCCKCIPIRRGQFINCLLSILVSFLDVVTSVYNYRRWWPLWIGFSISVGFSLIGIWSVWTLDYYKSRIYQGWCIFLICCDVIFAVYETTFYEDICEHQYDKDSKLYEWCTDHVSKLVLIAVKISSIILQTYFFLVTKRFTKMLRHVLSDNSMYFDLEDSAKINFEEVP